RNARVARDRRNNGQTRDNRRIEHDAGRQFHDQPFPRSNRRASLQNLSDLQQINRVGGMVIGNQAGHSASKASSLWAGRSGPCFSSFRGGGESSINAIPHTLVICVVAYFQAADWIDSLVS